MDKIAAKDSRVTHEYATVNGHKYHYLLALPPDGYFKATIFLIHGFPDLSFGWRCQIPMLVSQGLRVVAPDMLGYGRTDAPIVPPEPMRVYGMKSAADDMAELARQLNAPRIILGGHDWGGTIVYRIAAWKPQLVTHVFSVCTPFTAPLSVYVSTDELVNRRGMRNFGYQLQLGGPVVESAVKDRHQIKQFLKGIFGGRTPDGRQLFKPETGINLELLDAVGDSPLLNEEELEYYTTEYARHGLHGPLNWYRTRKLNWEDELELKEKGLKQPVLFIQGLADAVLKPELSKGMETFVPRLTRREAASNHWAQSQKPEEVNGFIKEWLQSVVFGGKYTL